MENRLYKKYKEEIIPLLTERFQYTSTMQVPKLEKIVLNMGVGDAKENARAIENSIKVLETISGQKPVVINAKKSVANFRLRVGTPIGCKVTLRGKRMYDFLDQLINIDLPRTRDFRGVNPNSFDGRGNYSLGTKEQLIFPEIDFDSVDKIRGLDISIVTTAENDEEARALLDGFGMPFRK